MVSVATPKPVSGLVSENEHGRSRVLQVITKLDMGGAEVVALDLVTALHGTIDFAVATVLDVEPTPVGKAMRAQLADLAIPVFPGTLGHYKKGGAIVAAWRLARIIIADGAHRDGGIVLPDERGDVSTSWGEGLSRVLAFLVRLRYGAERLWMADAAPAPGAAGDAVAGAAVRGSAP